MDAFMRLLDVIETRSRQENMTATRLVHLSLPGLKQPQTMYRYLRYGLRRKIIDVNTLQDGRWFGDIKCYIPTVCGERLLQVWKECGKEEKEKNGN